MVGTVVAERAFDIVCLVIIFTLTLFSQIDIIGGYASDTLTKIFNSGTHSTARRIINWLIIVMVLIGIFTTIRWAFKKFAHISIVQKIKEILRNIWHGLTSIRYLKNKGWFIFHSILMWVLYLAAIRVGMAAMRETNIYGIKESLSVLCMGSNWYDCNTGRCRRLSFTGTGNHDAIWFNRKHGQSIWMAVVAGAIFYGDNFWRYQFIFITGN